MIEVLREFAKPFVHMRKLMNSERELAETMASSYLFVAVNDLVTDERAHKFKNNTPGGPKRFILWKTGDSRIRMRIEEEIYSVNVNSDGPFCTKVSILKNPLTGKWFSTPERRVDAHGIDRLTMLCEGAVPA